MATCGPCKSPAIRLLLDLSLLHEKNYTVQRKHSQHTHTHPYEHSHANSTPMSIFEDCAGKSWKN
uniref:Uncharacterized protein n=1 Tax=Oryza glumipatula TaxID=40148 RepID=A0A0E0B556_9ORYZ